MPLAEPLGWARGGDIKWAGSMTSGACKKQWRIVFVVIKSQHTRKMLMMFLCADYKMKNKKKTFQQELPFQ